MKVAAAQIACALGDIDANLRKMRDFCAQAKENGVENPFLVRLTSENEVLFAGW